VHWILEILFCLLFRRDIGLDVPFIKSLLGPCLVFKFSFPLVDIGFSLLLFGFLGSPEPMLLLLSETHPLPIQLSLARHCCCGAQWTAMAMGGARPSILFILLPSFLSFFFPYRELDTKD
jgi:hypothetical protein